MDYREIPADQILYRYDVAEWDWDNNVLVYREDSGLRTYYLEAERHPDPLPLTLLLIAAEGTSGPYKGWGGYTSELMEAMRDQQGLASISVDAYLRLFGSWDPTDYPAFHERIEGCRPFLEEMGVRVRKTRRGVARGCPAGGEADGDEDLTHWSIEVPAWKHKRRFWV